MDGFRFKIDRRQLVEARVHAAAEAAVGDGAEHLLTEANRTVPLDESTLQRSGTVTQEDTTAAISYDTPYAVRQHEDLDLRHPGGRRAKWLELTMVEQSVVIGEFLAGAMSGRLR